MCHLFRNKGQTNPTFHNSVCNAKGKRCLCAVLVMRELTFKVCTGKFRAMLSMIVQIESNEACFNCRGEAYLMKLSIKHSRTQNCIIILKSASNLNGNLNCSKELEHYAS